jgi:hypothetical protein
LLRRRRISHPLLFEFARKFRRLVTDDHCWPDFKALFPELAKLIEHEKRATRSDLREGLALVVEACAARTDLKSLRVGWRRKFRSKRGKVFDFVGLQRVTFSSWTGLAESTVSRAFTLLRRAGLIYGPGLSQRRGGDGVNVIAQPWEPCDVTDDAPRGVRGFPAIRRIHESFFVALSMGHWLDNCRKARAPQPRTPATVEAANASRNVVQVGKLVAELARALAPPPDSG